jgi:hypothetical protein
VSLAIPTHGLFKNLTGLIFSRLTVTGYAGRIGTSHAFACKCECGNVIVTRGYCLTMGETKSCGCLLPDRNRERLLTHGMGGSPIWRIWAGMKTRCYNEKNAAYEFYGKLGVTVCDRWLHGTSGKSGFEYFYEDMGPRPSPKYSIDRIDTFGNYEPSNCQWATDTQQARNTRKTKRIEFAGHRRNPHEWAAATGIKATEILKRLNRGWAVERALTQPMRIRR